MCAEAVLIIIIRSAPVGQVLGFRGVISVPTPFGQQANCPSAACSTEERLEMLMNDVPERVQGSNNGGRSMLRRFRERRPRLL